jgi:hypothetical protein
MKTALKLQRILAALLITGVSILALASVRAADAPKVGIDGTVQIPLAQSSLNRRGINDE